MWKLAVAMGAGLAVSLAGAPAILFAHTQSRLNASWDIDVEPIVVPTDEASVARGRYLGESVLLCARCHGEDLGGKVLVDAPGRMRFASPNLTSGQGGVAGGYRAEDWDRSVRHGVDPTGRALVFMPSANFRSLSDDDLGAVVAWLRTVPPVDRPSEGIQLYPFGRALFGLGLLPLLDAEEIVHEREAPIAPPDDLVAYGRSIAQIAGCQHCHGENLSGGPIAGAPPDLPVPRNLTAHATGLAGWTEADFARAIRTGRRPDGSELASFMPWSSYAGMRDDELTALWAYLRTLPPTPFASR